MENHIIEAGYSGSGYTKTRPAYQYDYGQVLRLDGFGDLLPETFEMHFSIGAGEAITRIGSGGLVEIPNVCLERFGTLAVWLFLHDDVSDGETKYVIEIPVRSRAKATDQEPTPEQQSAITQAIAALNAAVEQTGQDVIDAGAAKTAAEAAQEDAEAAARSVMNATATATTLEPGAAATATVENIGGVITFELGIPEGQQGQQGEPGEESVMVATQITGNKYRLGIGRE